MHSVYYKWKIVSVLGWKLPPTSRSLTLHSVFRLHYLLWISLPFFLHGSSFSSPSPSTLITQRRRQRRSPRQQFFFFPSSSTLIFLRRDAVTVLSMQGLNWMMYTVHGGVTHARDTWCPFTGNSREQHVPVRSRLVLRVYDLTLRKNDAIFSSPNKHPSLSITPPLSLSLIAVITYL